MDLAYDFIYLPVEGYLIVIEHHDMPITTNCYDYYLWWMNGGNLVHLNTDI